MDAVKTHDQAQALVHALADFRHEMRLFLRFSEKAALDAGLHPQQHQLLLQIAGAPGEVSVSIAYVAERLGLRHNSTVELVSRSEQQGLLMRTADAVDGRRVVLRLTPRGRRLLGKLSGDHAKELNEMAPNLIRALTQIQRSFASARSIGK